MAEQKWWISCRKFTVQVNTVAGVITRAAPIVAKFKGQPLDNLKRWAEKFGDLRVERMDS
jgi:hypothetical protein